MQKFKNFKVKKDMKSVSSIRKSQNMIGCCSRQWSRIVSYLSRLSLVITLSFIHTNSLQAQTQEIDTIRRAELWQQQDFVKAYYVVAEPGGTLYSIFGHACLHMVCPAYELDYFFSYESEDVTNKILSFLSGNLSMGMAAITAEEYFAGMGEEGRGVKEFELNLPIDVKRNLWKVLDEKVAEGMYLPYDFESRGCAYACVEILNEALEDRKIEYGDWSPRFKRTRREIANDYAKHTYPWNLFFLNVLVGTDFDRKISAEEKLIIPTEVAEVWQNAKVDGEYILSREAHILQPSTKNHKASWITPMVMALLLLVLAIVSWYIEKPWIDWLILGIVTAIGAFVTYLVVFSTLPCTSWNWLIVPFNILPAICWKWRKYWSLPYAVVIGVWMAGMLISPHQLVDNAMLVLAIAFVLILLNNRNRK